MPAPPAAGENARKLLGVNGQQILYCRSSSGSGVAGEAGVLGRESHTRDEGMRSAEEARQSGSSAAHGRYGQGELTHMNMGAIVVKVQVRVRSGGNIQHTGVGNGNARARASNGGLNTGQGGANCYGGRGNCPCESA